MEKSRKSLWILCKLLLGTERKRAGEIVKKKHAGSRASPKRGEAVKPLFFRFWPSGPSSLAWKPIDKPAWHISQQTAHSSLPPQPTDKPPTPRPVPIASDASRFRRAHVICTPAIPAPGCVTLHQAAIYLGLHGGRLSFSLVARPACEHHGIFWTLRLSSLWPPRRGPSDVSCFRFLHVLPPSDAMRRISIDPLGMMSPRSNAGFLPARRRSSWYMRRPRLLTTLLFFAGFYLWLQWAGHRVEIPHDSFEFIQDESLADILNSTLGVRWPPLHFAGVSKHFRISRLSPFAQEMGSQLSCDSIARSIETPGPFVNHLQFGKIFVLNLPFRTDRKDAMTLAGATSNIKLDFVDGVTGDSIRQSAYPPPSENIALPAGIRGSWRTHMNALQKSVTPPNLFPQSADPGQSS